MSPPTWVTGQVLSASDVDLWFVPIVAYKTGSTGRTGTTRSVDPDLAIPLAASSTYEIRAMFMFSSTTAGNGFFWGFVNPTGSDGSWGVPYNAPGVGASFEGHLYTETITCGTPASSNQSCLVLGVIYTSGTSGNLSVSWATGGGAGTTNLNKGSYLLARRIT